MTVDLLDAAPPDPRTFETQGFAGLSGFLDDEDTRAAGLACDDALSKPLPPGCVRPNNTLVPLRWNDSLISRVFDSKLLVQRIADAVGADDLRWISGYLSVKEPRSAALWWHQDWWCWAHPLTFERRTAQIAVLCYLSETDEHSGALRLLAGSHRRSVPLHALVADAHRRAEDELDEFDPVIADQPGQLTFRAAAGDAVVIDYRLLHGTHPNRQPHRRDCLILNFTPSWRRLPADIQAHLIRHPALPTKDEQPAAEILRLLPQFSGRPRDLALSRNAPPRFAIA